MSTSVVRWFRQIQRRFSYSTHLRALVSILPYIRNPLNIYLSERQELRRLLIPLNRAFFDEQARIEVQTILGASMGSWPLIVRNLDLRRDLQAEIMPLIEKDYGQAGLLVILGEPGAGKTTLMRRIGKDLADSGRNVFELRASAQSKPECLIELSCARCFARSRPVVLIDNLFRCEGIGEVLSDPELRCTIVGTSRTNEYNPGILRSTANLKKLFPPRLQEKEQWPELGRPTEDELNKLRMKPECKNLSEDEWVRVTTIRQGNKVRIAPLLVIMLQLAAGGKPFDETIVDSLKFLHDKRKETYDAFGIICTFHQHGHPTPTCVLQHLAIGGSGYVAQLQEELVKGHGCVGAKGIIFSGDFHLYAECWETGHELIAEVASKRIYGDLTEHYMEKLISTTDPRENEELVFISRILLTLMARGHHSFVTNLMSRHSSKIDQLVRADTSQQAEWAVIFDKLNQTSRVKECLQTVNPQSPSRTGWMINLALKHSLATKAFSLAEGWLSGHPDDSYVRTKFLELVESFGTDDERKQAIKVTNAWIAEHKDNFSVRTKFLGLVESFGTDDERKQAIKVTNAWLAEHKDNSFVRTKFLGLVESFGTEVEKRQTIETTGVWLTEHPDNPDVRTRFLGFVESFGTEVEKRQAIETTGVWLTEHPDNPDVRTKFLGLAESFGTEVEKRQAIETTGVWLTEHPDNPNVYRKFLKTIERFGSTEQIQKMLPLIKEWRAKDPSLQYRHGRLLLRVDDPHGAIAEFLAILETQRDHQRAYLGLGDAYKCLGTQARSGGDNDAAKRHFAMAEKAYRKALIWAKRKNEDTAVILTHLGWLHIDQERWDEARNFFRVAGDEKPDYFGNYWGMGLAEKGLGRIPEAIESFGTALRLASKNTDGQPIAEITKELTDLTAS